MLTRCDAPSEQTRCILIAAAVAAIACLCGPVRVETAGQHTPFPLRVSADGRHLVDRSGAIRS